jgi:hypothetical protein
LLYLDGLNALEDIAGSLQITYCGMLQSIGGFNNLTYVYGLLLDTNEPGLLSLTGFQSLKTIATSFSMTSNLVDALNGFNELQTIGGSFTITVGLSRLFT